MLGSGFPLDPRLASGHFLFRSAHEFSKAKLDQLNLIGLANLTEALDAKPPAAIVALEGNSLYGYADSRAYRREPSPFSNFHLYIRIPR